MQYQGFVKFIGEKEEIGNGITKQTIVLEENTDREFKGGMATDFFRDKIELLAGVKVGDLLTVHFNSRANESKNQPGKFFNSISGWRIETDATGGSQPSKQDDDLPF